MKTLTHKKQIKTITVITITVTSITPALNSTFDYTMWFASWLNCCKLEGLNIIWEIKNKNDKNKNNLVDILFSRGGVITIPLLFKSTFVGGAHTTKL